MKNETHGIRSESKIIVADEQTILTKRDQSKENSMISKRDI